MIIEPMVELSQRSYVTKSYMNISRFIFLSQTSNFSCHSKFIHQRIIMVCFVNYVIVSILWVPGQKNRGTAPSLNWNKLRICHSIWFEYFVQNKAITPKADTNITPENKRQEHKSHMFSENKW